MKLNYTQLEIIELLNQKTEVSIRDISHSLNISSSLTYLHVNELIKLGLLSRKDRKIILSSHNFTRILCNLLTEDIHLIKILENEGIPILHSLMNRENKNIKDVALDVGISDSTAYPYFRKLIKRQIIHKKNGEFVRNQDLWGKLFDFIRLYGNHFILSEFDKVPHNAKIYFESVYLIVFSLKNEFDSGSKTAFSEYGTYGIALQENETFYRLDQLPKRNLDIQSIFLDSLRVAGTEESSRRRLYCYLFYRKNIHQLRKVRHPDLDMLKLIVSGDLEKYENFPTRAEIIQKGQDYDIKI